MIRAILRAAKSIKTTAKLYHRHYVNDVEVLDWISLLNRQLTMNTVTLPLIPTDNYWTKTRQLQAFYNPTGAEDSNDIHYPL